MRADKKSSWYDGWLYARLIDSGNYELRNLLLKFIEPNKSVLDIGCGTGGFSLKLARFSQYTLAIDISEKQINQAIKKRIKSGQKNIDFVTLDALEVINKIEQTFDYAVFSFVIHEMAHHTRLEMLKSVQHVARNIVILDYQVPQPKNIWGFSSHLIEFIAGGNHYQNYKDYMNRNGLTGILKELKKQPLKRSFNKKGIFQVVLI